MTTNPANVSLKYRVRVKYPDKREADAGLLRLKQEEHVDPWPIR